MRTSTEGSAERMQDKTMPFTGECTKRAQTFGFDIVPSLVTTQNKHQHSQLDISDVRTF